MIVAHSFSKERAPNPCSWIIGDGSDPFHPDTDNPACLEVEAGEPFFVTCFINDEKLAVIQQPEFGYIRSFDRPLRRAAADARD
ncbi:hypothetical protein [Leucobacter japonicus]|uniref:hypothetical protein n=1 Tax=Leucobacter japonicus TaxID=1461259 RepID=UPI000AA42039|nr:hypothetical protein [Leucobacter japonicus]